MLVRGAAVCGINLVLLATCWSSLRAQTAAAPTAYTVTANNGMFGTETVTKTYRLGSKALVDNRTPSDETGPKAIHIRTLYDLEKMVSLTWDPVNSSAPCGKGAFSGDWGDPFTEATELASQGATQVGAETIHGFAANILEVFAGPSGKMRVWVGTANNVILKAQMMPTSGAPQTVVEVTDVSLTPPPASVFAIPANCAAEGAAPLPPTDDEKIEALTGGNPQDFARAIYGPGSKDSCTVLFRVVKAGSMEPITRGFQIAVDMNLANEPRPSYTIGLSPGGRATFSGGGLHEVTPQIRNGVLRIDNAPDHFDVETSFGSGGSGSALIYKQCYAPQTVLLYVINNPDKLSDGGEFLWVKSGKYAAPAR
jgi:hypothetical protein